ncbi:MAG: hypothetical protein Q9227_007131 [Pyrenula ochraceoflavens]
MDDIKSELHICIAGAGMGGLTAALALAKHGFTQIDVYEMASNLGFVGAGIQLAPNMARILDKLGCWSDIFQEAVTLQNTNVRRKLFTKRRARDLFRKGLILILAENSSDNELTDVSLAYVEREYKYPHMVGHRSSLAGSIYNACKHEEKAIRFHFAHTVESVLSFSPRPSIRVQPRNGTAFTVSSDVLIAADGVKSAIRSSMLDHLNVSASIQDTGQSAYRIMLNRDQMAHDAELLELLSANTATRWIGEKRHIIAYPVSSKTVYNISTAQPDTNFAAAPSATYTTKGSKSDMLGVFHDFCPRVQKFLALVPEREVCEWKLRVHAPLPTWICGSVALLGDACHPTLPHLAQGAAQAIEDAAVLGVALAALPDKNPKSVNAALLGYEHLRKGRAETLVDLAAASGKALHLGEGAAREERDRLFKEAKEKGGQVPDKWADAEVQKMIYGHDCWTAAEDYFRGKELDGSRS